MKFCVGDSTPRTFKVLCSERTM